MFAMATPTPQQGATVCNYCSTSTENKPVSVPRLVVRDALWVTQMTLCFCSFSFKKKTSKWAERWEWKSPQFRFSKNICCSVSPPSFPPCKNGYSPSASGGHSGPLCKQNISASLSGPFICSIRAAASHGRCSHGICCVKKEKACHYMVESGDQSIIGKCISTASCGKWRRSLLMLNVSH